MKAENNEAVFVYFDLKAGWDVSQHIGGATATRELARLCSIDDSSNVLVAGCGNGFSACMLEEEFECRVVGIDINPAMVAKSSERVRKRGLARTAVFKEASATDLPFCGQQFDAVFSESVNSFIPEPLRALEEYLRVLVVGGRVGLNECVWLETPPEGLRRYMESVTGARFLSWDKGWDTLLLESGFELPEILLRRTSTVRQWTSERELLDVGEVARAWLTLPWSILSDAQSRRWVVSTLFVPPSIMRLFHYFGYGLFTAISPTGRSGK